ncbi:hypothetical protein V6247_26015, partial [Escherichia coli]
RQENNKTDNNQGSSNQSQNRRKKRIITGKVMLFLTTGHKQRRRRRRTGAAGARSFPFPEGTSLPGSLVVHARTMPVRKKGLPENGQTGSPFIKALQCSQIRISSGKAGLSPPPGCYLPPDS